MNLFKQLPEPIQNQPSAKVLQAMLERGRLPHALLLHGPVAEVLEHIGAEIAQALLGNTDIMNHPDFCILRPVGKMRQICCR